MSGFHIVKKQIFPENIVDVYPFSISEATDFLTIQTNILTGLH